MLKSVNLNLLPVLRALLREVSVSKAAISLGLSQPATSSALARLRTLLGDPLLVQVGRNMRLTPRAVELAATVDGICGQIDDLLQDKTFDPKTADCSFIVAAPDYLAFLVGEHLLPELQRVAPKVRVHFVEMPHGSLPECLASGAVDVSICADFLFWPQLIKAGHYPDRMIGLVRDDHPLLDVPEPTKDDFAKYPLAAFHPGMTDAAFRSLPPERMVLLKDAFVATQQFMLLPFLAVQTNCVARIPKSLADRFINILPMRTVELPPGPNDLDTCILWSAAQAGDPGQEWFRGVLMDSLARTHL